jgi:hypothetical protein
MNYTYQIAKNLKNEDAAVKEFFDKKLNVLWTIDVLTSPKSYDKYSTTENKSWNRTKKWLIENHPEFFI